jgi:hypothetical protein
MSQFAGPIDSGEAALIAQGFGKYTRAAYRIGARYPRYAGRLLRQAISKESAQLNQAELGQVIEETVVPAFEPAVAGAVAGEALEAAAVVTLPEVAAVVAVGALACAAYHKMAGSRKKAPKIDLNKIRFGVDKARMKKAADKINQQQSKQYKPNKISQPVASGEVIRGAVVREESIPGGIRVHGREVLGTTRGAISSLAFTMAGAYVATPLAYPGSRMGVLSKTYAKYNIKRWNVRVITSSPTTDDGQILTYFHHNRHDPVINWTGAAFITTVLSAANSVVGPKWTDSHLPVTLTSRVMESSFPLGDGHMDLGAGDVFVFTRSSSADSYIVMCDYVIDFTEPQIMSRIDLVPFARAQWFYTARNAAYNWTINSTIADLFAPGGPSRGADGTASGDNAVGTAVGDIYRFVCDIDNSIFTTGTGTTITPSNLFNHQAPDNAAIGLRNGSTIYCVFIGSGGYRFFPTLAAARTYTNPFRAGLTGAGNVTLVGWQCLVDSMEGTLLQTSV